MVFSFAENTFETSITNEKITYQQDIIFKNDIAILTKSLDWLEFNSVTRTYRGTPKKQDLDNIFKINIIGFDDGYTNATDSFNFSLNSQPPKIVGDLTNAIYVIDFEEQVEISQLDSIFEDSEGDPLEIKTYWRNNTVLQPLPDWLVFSGDRFVINGKFTYQNNNIPFNETNRQFLDDYEIVVEATDIAGKNSSVIISVRVNHIAPRINSTIKDLQT